MELKIRAPAVACHTSVVADPEKLCVHSSDHFTIYFLKRKHLILMEKFRQILVGFFKILFKYGP
jgi:hypothetical protein